MNSNVPAFPDLPDQLGEDRIEKRARMLNWSSFLFVLLQSACTAILTISGLRVAIGLGALASAVATTQPAKHFHQDAIRIPMLVFAVVGACLNLYVLWHLRRLRNRAAAQWRIKPLTIAKRRSEIFQFWLSILTFVLVAAEWITHTQIHRVP